MRRLYQSKFSSALGAAVWLILVCADQLGLLDLGLLSLLFLLAPLVVVPVGLCILQSLQTRAAGSNFLRLARVLQPLAALLAAASFFRQPGGASATLAGLWLVVCLLLALSGLLELLHGGHRSLPGLAAAMPLLYVAIGGAWLMASRLGLTPMRFTEPLVLLTAVHFHYAGFAAPLMLLALARTIWTPSFLRTIVLRLVAALVLLGPAMLAVGFVIGPRVKLAAGLLLVVGEVGLALLTLVALPRVSGGMARVLLAISSVSALAGMMLAALWVLGDYRARVYVDLARMIRIHGAINSLGFILCGLGGWLFAIPSKSARVEVPS